MNPILSTLRQALAINDPHAVIVTRATHNPRKWVTRNLGGDYRCTGETRKVAVFWGRYSQAMIIRKYTADIRAYCGRTGKRLA